MHPNDAMFSCTTIQTTPCNTTASLPSTSEIKPFRRNHNEHKKGRRGMIIFKNNLVKTWYSNWREILKVRKQKPWNISKTVSVKCWITWTLYLAYPVNWDASQIVWRNFWKRRRKSFDPTTYQVIYKFWRLSDSINWNGSRCNVVNISKCTFLQ